MTRIILSGCNGRLGQYISEAVATRDDMQIVAGIDLVTEKRGKYPVYADLLEFGGSADIVVDCSYAGALDGVLSYCTGKGIALVVCTTGYSEEQLAKIAEASKKIAIFRSANMSLGVALVTQLAKNAAALLGDAYDVEIIEKHHNRKIDAPSGTALMLADAVSVALSYEAEYVYSRQPVREARRKNEIGIHSLRGGTIVGDHAVIFAGTDEVIEISHSAASRAVFANGAVKAVSFTAGKAAGLYNMNDLVAEYVK